MPVNVPNNAELRQLDDDALEDLIEEVSDGLCEVKSQVEAAKSRSRTGEFADPDWFARARAAQRHYGRAHQKLLRESGRRKREQTLQAQRDENKLFKEVCREELDPEDFEAILSIARSRAGEETQ